MGGQVLDYEAKRIRNDRDILAVFNMLLLGNDEQKVKELYPEQFEAGKKRFMESKRSEA